MRWTVWLYISPFLCGPHGHWLSVFSGEVKDSICEPQPLSSQRSQSLSFTSVSRSLCLTFNQLRVRVNTPDTSVWDGLPIHCEKLLENVLTISRQLSCSLLIVLPVAVSACHCLGLPQAVCCMVALSSGKQWCLSRLKADCILYRGAGPGEWILCTATQPSLDMHNQLFTG